MGLTVYEDVKNEMLEYLFATVVQLKDSSGEVVGTHESGGETYVFSVIDWLTPDGGQVSQDSDIVFDLDAGDNVRSLDFRNDIPGSGDDLFTYQFETVYNYATAGTFTISGMKVKID